MATSTADVAIIGAGAAGLATAIFTARAAQGRKIQLLDGASKLGAKILVSGGGRCNVTNTVVRPEDFWGGSRHTIKRVLNALPVERTITFFREIGVSLHEEENGKLFPDTNQARTVLDALIAEARRLGMEILTQHRVMSIEARATHDEAPAHFHISTSTGPISARFVVLATGGMSLPKTGSDGGGYLLARSLGHSITPTTPALAPLVLEGDFHNGLSGLTHDVELAIRIESEKPVHLAGSMLWTHFGVSGPVVLNASRFWHMAQIEGKQVLVTANFLPGLDFDAAQRRLFELASAQPKAQLHNAVASLIPARLADAVLKQLGIAPQVQMSQLTRDDRRRLASGLTAWPLPIRDSRGYAFAEVTAGGVRLTEIDPATMESRNCPGLYLVGEILDVDGRIGGFNFQWSWSSGFVAGRALAARLCDTRPTDIE